MPPRNTTERFWQHVAIEEPEQCWEWRGAQSQAGYGAWRLDSKSWRAHRYAWTVANGEIPEGFHVHHRCGNRLCVNPAHLEALSIHDHFRHPDHQRVRIRGSVEKRGPDVWRFRVFMGNRPGGSVILASRTFHGTRDEAGAALSRFVVECHDKRKQAAA